MSMLPGSMRLNCGPGRTKQSMKDETDVNRIVARYAKTGLLTHVNTRSPVYTDVSEARDYREALEQVRRVDEFFVGLPSKIRARFANDPILFMEFMMNPDMKAEAEELGLVKKEPEAPIDEVPGPGIQARGTDGRFESPKPTQ